MNFDVRYEHFEQQAETAAQKWQKGMYIKKIKKRYQKENHFPRDIAIEFQEQSDHTESNRDFSHFVWYRLQITRFMPSKKYQRLYKW